MGRYVEFSVPEMNGTTGPTESGPTELGQLNRGEQMRAVRLHELGGIEALQLEDVEPSQLQPGQVRIEVHAAGCNFADTLQIQGLYQTKPPLPFTPGLEVAGEVIEVADGVTTVAVGERVMGWVPWGGYATQAVMSDWAAIPIPYGMDFVTAAAFPIAYGTAFGALSQRRVALTEGETLLVHGAAGGVGLAAVEIGKAMGAQVVACAGTPEKLELCTEHGADFTINYTTEPIRDRVKALVGGVDVVLDPVGGDAFSQSLRCTNTDGRLVVIGFAGGDIQTIAANYLLLKNISVAGYAFSIYSRQKPQAYRDVFASLETLYERGDLKPYVSAVFSLDDIKGALTCLAERQATGKIVVQMK
jgi:NADPH:quinone reductase